jgi:hypothetical protein
MESKENHIILEDKEESNNNQIHSQSLTSNSQFQNISNNQQQILFKKPNERIKTEVKYFYNIFFLY